jgi:DNA repair protein RAD5
MTDCPEKLTTGASLIVTIHIYLLSGAFRTTTKKIQSGDARIQFGFNEGLESEEERYYNWFFDSFSLYITIADSSLRQRKNAVVKLLEVVGLKPQVGPELQEEALKVALKRPIKKVKEVVGDGEEIELEDAEVLSDNDIDAIYQKLVQQLISLVSNDVTFTRAQHNDRSMGQMEPAHSFNLTLRGYQKQALLFVPLLEFEVSCWYHLLTDGCAL